MARNDHLVVQPMKFKMPSSKYPNQWQNTRYIHEVVMDDLEYFKLLVSNSNLPLIFTHEIGKSYTWFPSHFDWRGI